MTLKKKEKHTDLLIFKRFDELLAVEKTFLSSIQPLDQVINMQDVKKPAVGVIEHKSQVFILVDPWYIIGKRKRKYYNKKSHIKLYGNKHSCFNFYFVHR